MPKTMGATRLSRRLTPRTMMDGKALLPPWPPSAVVHELRSIPHFDGADMRLYAINLGRRARMLVTG
jgi:hypothetical protein